MSENQTLNNETAAPVTPPVRPRVVPPSAPASRDIRNRRWVYTYNNPTQEIEESLQAWSLPVWHVYGREIAPTTGTPHLQGAFIVKNPMKWSSIVSKFPGIWVEPMKGTPDEVFDYCTKVKLEYFCKCGCHHINE